MQSNGSRSATKAIFATFVTLLLALAITPQLAQAQKFKVLHRFNGSNGAYPTGGLIRDSAGNFYGMTSQGGSSKTCPYGCGTVFRLTPTGKETVLYSFTGKNGDGEYPASLESPYRDAGGNIYGTTYDGGDFSTCSGYGCGVVFKLSKKGRETVLHTFGRGTDGLSPGSGVVLDAQGNIYGTTEFGGANNGGTLFEVAKGGGYSILHSFDFPGEGTDGSEPVGPLIIDSSGNLYGTTTGGGDFGCGTIFGWDATGNYTIFFGFPCGSGGGDPLGQLLMDSAGNFYGTTKAGGNGGCFDGGGCGVVFKVDSTGAETVLYTFSGGADGRYPFAGVVMDSSGNLYGTTINGGSAGYGVAFKLDPSRNETVLHNFADGSDGGFPDGLIMNPAGRIYGLAAGGGNPKCQEGCGVVFTVTPSSR